MDHVASLLRQAEHLERKVFSSLPWGFRLATVFLALDQSSIDSWGRQMGALMLKAGVTDMPDPGPRWNPEKPNAEHLPRGYLFDFAKKAYGVALKKSGNPDDAGDAMMDIMMAYLSGKKSIDALPMKSAMSFVLKGVDWAAGDIRKKNKGGESTTHDDEGDETTLDLVDDAFEANPYWNEDPNAFRKIEDTFPGNAWEREVLPAVNKVHPDMMRYFQLLSEGVPGKHIVEKGLLPNFSKEVEEKGMKSPWPTWHARAQKARKVVMDIARRHSN
jgi:hypothetical protein